MKSDPFPPRRSVDAYAKRNCTPPDDTLLACTSFCTCSTQFLHTKMLRALLRHRIVPTIARKREIDRMFALWKLKSGSQPIVFTAHVKMNSYRRDCYLWCGLWCVPLVCVCVCVRYNADRNKEGKAANSIAPRWMFIVWHMEAMKQP